RKVATQSRWHQSVALLICACAMSTVAALAFASVAWRAKAFQKDELPASLQGLDLDVTGKVMGLPQRQADGWRFRFQISEAFRQGSQTPLALPQQLQLGWYANESTDAHALPTLQVGQRWRLPLRLKQPHGLVNPGGFDMELWLWEQGIHATGYVRTGANSFAPVLLDHAFVWWDIEAWRQAARDRIQTRVNEPRWAAVVSALLLGDQAGMDRADWEVFRATGVAHLMSISGLHITLWACVARWLIAWCWRRSDLWGRSWCLWIPAPHAAHWGGLLMAWAYALFSGWGVPSQRTVAMLASVCVLHSQAVRWPLHTQWLLAMVVVVVLDPWALLQAGFWLSFVAVAMLFMGQPAKAIPAPDAWKISTTAVDKYMAAWQHLCALCKEQWLISICLAPLCVVLFQQVSVVGLLANLFAIPWVTWVVTPLAFAGLVWTPFWQVSAWAAQSLCSVLEPMAHWSWAVWHTAAPPWWLALIGMAGAVMWAFARKKVPRFLGLLLIVPCLCWLPDRPSTGTVEVLAADIGQGNAVLVRTATHSLLFDTGPRYGSDSDAGERVWLPLLQRMAERLDLLILSHQDADHTGGALSVHAAQPQAEILSSITASHWLGQSLTMQRCEAGQRWQWDSVTLEVLHPLAIDYQQNLTPNARSCVLRIHAQDQTVLLTADIEAFQEQALVERLGEKLQADVLLVPHHGSKTSSTEVFLKTVNPRMAWVQAGYRNRYGHPAPAVMSRYAAQGIPVWDSPHCGAMHWRSDAPMQVDCERDRQRRYWHHRLP
ncbi:MAG: DNA internalization-related competence protein ComEC/Rec2, partial [Betaproteobacteria bacterium]|nr:DNA internalization-related competence protein ComEC/Rec2 [Betaproteobacteria bacterium]